MKPINDWTREELIDELTHFQEVAALALPGRRDYAKLPNIDYFVGIEPYKGRVGGDHVALVNFEDYGIRKKIKEAREKGDEARAAKLATNLDRFGILVADAAGHMITDNTTINYLHAAFKTGVAYEIRHNGEVTAGLFETLNTILYDRSKHDNVRRKPYVTLSYGEAFNDGRFRFISAGHPPPLVFSSERDRIEMLDGERTKTSTPMGIFPSRYHVGKEYFEQTVAAEGGYDVNEIHLLGAGDVMLLYTDGLLEQNGGEMSFREARLEQVLRESKSMPASGIYESIKRELFAFCPPDDDVAVVVVKKK